MRVFVGLDIDDEIRGRMEEFIREVRVLAPDVRWVTPESLHVTLKFVGEKPDSVGKDIEKTLGSIAAEAFEVSFRGCGFFPTAKAALVFWGVMETSARLAQWADEVEG